MPLVKKRLSIAAGATSDQVLAGTTYEYVDPGTRIDQKLHLLQLIIFFLLMAFKSPIYC